jgi:hypothetical protein
MLSPAGDISSAFTDEQDPATASETWSRRTGCGCMARSVATSGRSRQCSWYAPGLLARRRERLASRLPSESLGHSPDSGSGRCPAEGDAGSCSLPGAAGCSPADLAAVCGDLPGCRAVPTGWSARPVESHDAVGGLEHLAVEDAVLDLKLDEVLGLDAV